VSNFLDGLFAGIAYVALAGVRQTFAKTINFVSGVTANYNAATGALDLTIALPVSPSTTIPVSDDGAGTVTVGSDPANGIAMAFRVPNDDGSGDAFVVDNSAGEVQATGTIVGAGGVKIAGGYLLITSEVSAGSVATPATGFALYVNSSDHKLYAKGRSGTVTPLANP
jgi:hypothetical protein